MKSISSMKEKFGDRIQFISSAGKGAKNGKVKDDNDNQDGNDVNSSSPPLIISIQCDASSSFSYWAFGSFIGIYYIDEQ